MQRIGIVFCMVWIFASFSEGQTTSRNEHLERFDRSFAVARGNRGYEVTIQAAERALDEGVSSSDASLEARALVRLAVAQLSYGKWGDEWEGWLERADKLTQDIESPSLARAEYLMIDGYLKAMYLQKVREGVDRIKEAIVVGKTLEDIKFFGHVFQYLSRVAAFDGQSHLVEQYMYQSILFAIEAKDVHTEYQSRISLLRTQRVSNATVDAENRLRVLQLAKQLDLPPSIFTKDDATLESQIERIQPFLSELDKEEIENTGQVKLVLEIASSLSFEFLNSRDWEQCEKYYLIAHRAAEKLQDNFSLTTLVELKACLFAKDGKGNDAKKAVRPLLDLFERSNCRSYMAPVYRRLAMILGESGDSKSSMSFLRLADGFQHEEDVEFLEQAQSGAKEYFDEVMESTKLNGEVRARKQSLDRTLLLNRILAVAIPLMGVCFFFWQRSRHHLLVQRDLRDQVEQKTASLRYAKEEAEAANQAKTEFVARINHEIRNPLAAILGSTELLPDARPEELPDIQRTIHSCSLNLLDTVNDVLDFTRIESGDLECNDQEFSPLQLLDVVCDIVRPRISAATKLVVEIDPSVPERVRADESKLRQILVNLGQNAARHTSQGQIRLACTCISSDQSESDKVRRLLKFTVADTGSGIPEAQLDTIFDRFSGSRVENGSGLGLFISTAFAKQMRGSIECESEMGKGTTFEVAVPVEAVEESSVMISVEGAAQTSETRTRVLVVDDQEALRLVAGRLLNLLGYACETTGDWNEAVPILRSGVDVVLLDLRMPEISGFEFLRRLRGLELPTVPLVYAVTGDATSDTQKRALEAGFDGFLPKPYSKQTISELLDPHRNPLQYCRD